MALNYRIFKSLLKHFEYFENKPHIGVGVSGGPDSLALAYLLKQWIKYKKGKLTAIIFDHGIRYNSKIESFQVKKMLTDLNIYSLVVRPSKNRTIKKNMSNARGNRFEGLIKLCKKKYILHLFLGHHFDDNMETYLLRKINGSNLDGLESINKTAFFQNIQILRPLIEIDKKSILTFNKINKLHFISDPTNKDLNYTRVKLRNFLQNNKYKKQVKKDFIKIKKKIPDYKKMIWETLIHNLVYVSATQIKISLNNLMKLDDLIIEKHILCILKFFNKNKAQTKSSKIMIFLDILKKPSFKTFNLSGINIKKNSDFLIFSQK
ncbi:tRNA lysidine(34) synthetase TilS [Alphaproteobacteria bacterium]|nr:tRNA lysidine(34) synthetase TilS [Alphaproteobacteria bacterium]